MATKAKACRNSNETEDYKYIIECDGSFNAKNFATGLGNIIKDGYGTWKAAGSAACEAEKPVCAREKAIVLAIGKGRKTKVGGM